MFNRNFTILFISQIFSSAPPAITILLSGIIGSSLIQIKYLATLPTGIMVGGIAVSSIFASSIMSLKGRKFGFCLGSIVGTFAALFCAYSIFIENFYFYCFSNFFIGFAMAFTHQYRFAAAEVVAAGPVLPGLVGSLPQPSACAPVPRKCAAAQPAVASGVPLVAASASPVRAG